MVDNTAETIVVLFKATDPRALLIVRLLKVDLPVKVWAPSVLLNSTDPGGIDGSIIVTFAFTEPVTDQLPLTFNLNPFVFMPLAIK
jgi:hypothetical protein